MTGVRLKALALVFVFLMISSLGYVYVLDIETPVPTLLQDDLEGREDVYFGVISRYSPRSILAGYEPLMQYLTENTPYHFRLRLSRTYLETVQQLAEGDVDFASLGNYTYIQARKMNAVRCIAVPLNERGTLDNHDDIIVQEDSPIRSIEDLKGKSFAFASRQSFSAWMGIWMLYENGIRLTDLSGYDHLSYHDLVAEKVLRGDYDAGMVKTIVADQYRSSGLRVLARSPAIPGVPLVASKHVDSNKVEIVLKALLDLESRIASGDLSTDGWDKEVAYGFRPGQDSLYRFPREILEYLAASDYGASSLGNLDEN